MRRKLEESTAVCTVACQQQQQSDGPSVGAMLYVHGSPAVGGPRRVSGRALLSALHAALRRLPGVQFQILDEVLNDVEHLAEGKLRGPAALAVRDGQLYTGLLGGQVVRVDPDNVEDVVTVTRLGHPDCMSELEGEKCGRPMGMQFHTDGKLYLTDAYHGLYRVDVDTGKWEHLAGGDQYIGGQRVRLACDLAVARDGRVFWSDASTEVGPEDMTLELLSAGSGRLLRYDPRTNRTETLIGRVNCATGVTLAPDESYVLVAEAGNDRILSNENVGSWDVFAEGLPGVPATIRPGGPSEGGYLVTLAMTHPSFLLWLRRHPTLGRTIMRLSAIAESAFASINDLVQNEVSRDVVYMVSIYTLLF
ncbi:hypothetical protein B566_EDAN009770 [Ephemera danica]|nr:hypothetical protein B566_EDAN009770 [Ephemera danica]